MRDITTIMNSKNIVIIASAMLLTSCGIYKKHQTPEIPPSQIVSQQLALPAESQVAIPTWDNYFTDSHLHSLIKIGLENNADLQSAIFNIDKAQAMLLSSKLAYIPSFALAPTGNITSVAGGKASYSYNLPLQASWEIDLSGRILNNKRQVNEAFLQTQESVKLVQTSIISAIANSYYTLLMLDQQAEITSATLLNLQKNVEIMKSLKEAGIQSEAAVVQASATYNSVKISYEELLRDIQITENSLALLLNEPPHSIERSTMQDTKEVEFLTNSISLAALANRPDVKVAEYELSKSFYGINIARSALYPSFTLGGSVGWSNNLGAIVNPGNLLLSAIGNLTQPLFNAGINRANIKVAKLQYEQSLIAFQHALLRAGNEVNDALITYQTANAKKALRTQQVADLDRAVIITEQLMISGLTTYLEVLYAQNTNLEAQLYQTADWFELMQTKITLFRALGGL